MCGTYIGNQFLGCLFWLLPVLVWPTHYPKQWPMWNKMKYFYRISTHSTGLMSGRNNTDISFLSCDCDIYFQKQFFISGILCYNLIHSLEYKPSFRFSSRETFTTEHQGWGAREWTSWDAQYLSAGNRPSQDVSRGKGKKTSNENLIFWVRCFCKTLQIRFNKYFQIMQILLLLLVTQWCRLIKIKMQII